MKVSLNWLKEYVDIVIPAEKLAEKLTMAGLEVKKIQVIGGDWQNVVTGKIVDIGPHPNADRLKLVTLDLVKEKITVVTGAPNIKTGITVPFARVGAKLIDGHTGQQVTLKPAKIRGVASEGMVCSEKELGISDNHEGIMVLPDDAPLGIPLADYLGDSIFDVEVTPNRPDCLNVIGIAREIAALTDQQVRLPDLSYTETGEDITQCISIEIANPELCSRYTASLIRDIKIAPSPRWMQQRLLASGMRPINNIVDITNYVMLEFGQPLHAFDYNLIRDKKIIVRRAKNGEAIPTLDGVERFLNQDMLAITDPGGPVAVAGVMGGASSEVSDNTRDILLESASFNSTSIRRTSSNLLLKSEASLRFERGISQEYPLPALKRATQLIVQLAVGKAAKGIVDVYPGKTVKLPVYTSGDEINKFLGTEFHHRKILDILTSLGFECEQAGDGGKLRVFPPFWRTDIKQAADLAEEIARIAGYDKIPVEMLSAPIPVQKADKFTSVREKIRDILTGCGLLEIISYSMSSSAKIQAADPGNTAPPLHITNPMSPEQEYLRTTLRPALLGILAQNQKHEEEGIKLFEIGNIYLPVVNSLPEERPILAAVFSGPRYGNSWMTKNGLLNFYDAKGVIETIFNRFAIQAKFEAIEDQSFYPGRASSINIADKSLGKLGELHPSITEKFELLPQPVALFEINLAALASLIPDIYQFRIISRFPIATRDIAVVVDKIIKSSDIIETISSFSLVISVKLFDVFTGGQIPSDKKSLGYRIVFQSTSRTLSEQEIEKIRQAILNQLKSKFGAQLRS